TAPRERRNGTAARVDAIAVLVGDIQPEPATLGTTADAATGLTQAIAAAAQLQAWREAAGGAAGEYLHHAADGVGAIQARLRAAHDLHAFDLRQRQVLQHGQAEIGGVDAHAIDQHHGVRGVGAAQE